MSSDSNVFNKDNLNQYLNELSKAYKKLGGKNTKISEWYVTRSWEKEVHGDEYWGT